ncbi:MAG TPA: primosome assembly protein PriA, partial [Actinomycetota bacterium]
MIDRRVSAGVQVVVDVPLFHLDRPFSYRVPEALRADVSLGSRVKVPFGGRKRVDGWVVGFVDDDELPADAREILRVVSPLPAFDADGLELLRWVAARYAGTLIDVVRLAVPPRVAAIEKQPQEAVGGPDGAAAPEAAVGPGPGPAPSFGDPLVARV